MATSPIYNWPEPDNTDLVKNGALAIRTLGNAIDTTMATMVPKTIVDAKGDLIAGTAADTTSRLAVGNNGETLVADSSTSTGLRYQSLFGANKNAILNADFRINQRAFTSTTTSATYGFDRWRCTLSGGTVTYSAQAFTAGAAPVAGYEAINYARLVTTSQSASSDRAVLNQLVEDVRTLSGQTVTVSFWAQAGSGTPKVNVVLNQNFGTGGSSSVNAPIPTAQTISTSWARYSFTIANPSVSGKTISATDSRLNVQIYVSDGGDQSTGVGAQNNTFNIWGVQLEAGSVATAFQTATGTIQGELAACQRYYWRQTVATNQAVAPTGGCVTSTIADSPIQFPATMRVAPTSADIATLQWYNYGNGSLYSSGTFSYVNASVNQAVLRYTHGSGVFTTGQSGLAISQNPSGYVGFSAEL